MVSLVNFKSVSDDLQQQQGEAPACATSGSDRTSDSQRPARDSLAREQDQLREKQQQQQQQERELGSCPQDQTANNRRMQSLKLMVGDASNGNNVSAGDRRTAPEVAANSSKSGKEMFCPVSLGLFPAERDQTLVCSPGARETPAFVVTWRNLRFAIEPKWLQRLVSASPLSSARSFKRSARGQPPAADCGLDSSCPRPEEAKRRSAESEPEAKVVLDLLDGSFRSGELTAILGPSGAGKTTLLDCLTGHRKHGLSGSIRISSSASSCKCCSCGCYCCSPVGSAAPKPSCGLADCDLRQPQANQTRNSYSKQRHSQLLEADSRWRPSQRAAGSGDNLKVSIIPQNDHLMGHLTVYETLNYASKMKNCFDGQFDHKLNIRRVAQQLGLMSCLGTRINKLSGGQYKRVSIAQELLSSPDILILDEPTSGLDAMTCYQTVQVLRKLTDDRRASGQNQIAVILTIHQPNSDVFQQFNHVYVVAQGGKCIYEGPPSSIESVISQVGIRLPSSHYNPATMIVEIAAGKFGASAILELNDIQKKQYDFVPVSDEQTSTGDSAVDCPSSSSAASSSLSASSSSSCGSSAASNDEDDCDQLDYPRRPRRGAPEAHNNGNAGLLNEAFVMEAEPASNKEVIVIVREGLEESSADRKCKKPRKGAEEPPEAEARRRKRRRTRKRTADLMGVSIEPPACRGFPLGAALDGSASGSGSGPEAAGSGASSRPEKRLKLNSLKADQRFPFWRHTYLHFHRSWLSIVRDPMLCSMQLALHIIVPVMVSLVYGMNVGRPNACPRAGPMDIMAYALEPTDSALQLQEELRTTLENIGYIFFKLYGIIFAAMTVTVLTFPLDMHVLVKEFRNGWYGLASYFLGRTLADIPFQLTLPLLAMSLSYYATGQPYSYLQWRFLSITSILILSSLIAQSQGLLFGAILMDRMKAAVFVAPAATTPIILFAGFLVRTQSIPHYLRPLSNLSYLRYAIEACLISRYGFNQCECDPAVFNQTVPELPPIARSMLDYWLSSFKSSQADAGHDTSAANSTAIETTTTALAGETSANPDLFTKLLDSLGKANSFGRNITSCEQVVPYPMIDYDLKDSQLLNCFAILIFMLLFTRLLTFFIVCFKVKRKV